VEWELVASEHYAQTGLERPATSLKAKFKRLRDHPVIVKTLQNYINHWSFLQVPTGDPSCPPHVRKAKHAANLINQRVELDNDDEENEEEEEDDGPGSQLTLSEPDSLWGDGSRPSFSPDALPPISTD
jgi:hypothetical protein